MKTRRFLVAVVLTCGLGLPLQAARADLLFDNPLPFDLLPTPRPAPAADDPHLYHIDCSVIVGWYDDNHFLQMKNGQLLKVAALTGKAERVTDQARLEASLDVLAAMRREETPGFGPIVDPQKGKGGGGPASPDGKWTAVVRGGNLIIINKDTKAEKKLTQDGSDIILNGKTDWVYEEELYGRGNKQVFWWSPNSQYIAFLRLDDTNVPVFTILDHTQRSQTPERWRYPKSGQANPSVKLGIVKIDDGTTTWADLADFPVDLIISRVGWLPDSSSCYGYFQDRPQTWLDLGTVPVKGGRPTILFRDKTKAWTQDMGPVRFLKNGDFIYFSERSGYKHLYHYAADGKLKNAVTSGEWDAKSLQKIDEDAGLVYFSGTKDGWLDNQAFKVKLDGTGMERITKEEGTHDLVFSPDGKFFTDTHSSFRRAPRITLHRNDGSLVRLIDEAVVQPTQKKGKGQGGKSELVEITAPDGFGLYGIVSLPPGYDPAKKYPVWFKTYAGPHAPQVRNKFGGGDAATNEGYIVFVADPRSASGKGAVSAWACYKQLGVSECQDIETCIKWLLEKYPGADAKRVGMSGTSYGGYITAYCMTHTKVFAAGVAGAPVTDWHNYDSIYTERYNHLPSENRAGYNAGSATLGAKNLHGRLLLVHGMKDDNVHVQNTIEMMDALQKANKDFEVMLYPHARHGGFGQHFTTLQKSFMKRTLQPGT